MCFTWLGFGQTSLLGSFVSYEENKVLCGTPEMCFTRVGFSITHKYQEELKILPSNKHSSLLGLFVRNKVLCGAPEMCSGRLWTHLQISERTEQACQEQTDQLIGLICNL